MRRIHYEAGMMLNATVVCGMHHSNGRMLRTTTNRKRVTCKRCRVWLRLMYPRPRNLPLAKRKLHFYGPGLDEVTARCGMYNHMGLVTGKMANVTCGRCRRLLGLRRAKKMNANRELFDTGLVVHRRYTPGMFG